ncbi:MAG: FAD-dependent monooxygenase, partial [Betaproteobacteria bacterium]
MHDESTRRRQVIIVGAGPVGLAMALDWAQRGHDVLVLAANAARAEGSRAICFAKRTLEICDRLGCGAAIVAKGVSWNVGKVFLRESLLYEFDLLPEPGHERPAFVNVQQYYFEQFQLDVLSTTRVDLRWNHRVIALTQHPDHVTLIIQCPDGDYTLHCDWLIACDGAGSPIRKMLGLKSEGKVFQDRFLIADVKMRGESLTRFKTERWFWFDPPFHRNQSALLHKQADDVWRIDFQLGWQADPELEKQPERVRARVQAMLGEDAEFSLEWVSVYTFQCRRMDRFVHDRVIFAGDAAHQVSPFGARGANSGIQDADNLGWKLDLVVRGLAPAALLESYDSERSAAADDNILNSTRSTDFITPKNEASRMFRDATLELAARHPFARR